LIAASHITREAVMKTVTLVALAVLLALPAWAGDARAPKQQGTEEIREHMGAKLRARVQEKIGAWLTTEIATRVALDDNKSKQLADAVRAHMQRKHERRAALKEAMHELRSLVDSKAADAKLKSQLDAVIGAAARDDDMHELLSDTARFMSVPEQARFALAMPEIMKEMRQMMKEARRDGRGRGAHPRAPFDGSDGFED
jgi:hypothetical protein